MELLEATVTGVAQALSSLNDEEVLLELVDGMHASAS